MREHLKQWYGGLPADGAVRNLLMTGLLALVCAGLVSSAALILQPKYQARQAELRRASMQHLIASIPALEQLLMDSDADVLETKLVNLDTGCFVDDIDEASFDARVAENDPEQSRALQTIDDQPPLLKRRSLLERIHLLYSQQDLQMAILPVHGPGYQSTLYAWLVLDSDLNTIIALNIFEHADTPGIGSRVEDESWQQQWAGKQLRDDNGVLRIAVEKNASDSIHTVDGISGATRTSAGVGNMLRFWVDDNGYGPLIARLKQGNTC